MTTSIQSRPFLEKTSELRWYLLTPSIAQENITYFIKYANSQLDALSNTSFRDYDSTFLIFENILEDLHNAWVLVAHLDAVNNSSELRKVHNDLLPLVTTFSTDIYLNEKLYKILKEAAAYPSNQDLSAIKKRFIAETIQDFEDNGAGLSNTDKAKLKDIETELALITQKYSENVLDATNAWEMIIDDASHLAGLPDSAIQAAYQAALAKNYGTPEKPNWRFTLQAPSYLAVMTYLDNDDLRKKIWEARNTIGREDPYSNTDLIWKILKLRHERALLLGKTHFADQVLARRMAKTGEKALQFIEDMHSKVKKFAYQDAQAIRDFKAKTLQQPADLLQPWEVSYWAEKLRQALYDFDEEELRPYFQIENVVNGMFKIAENLFNIRIVEQKTNPHNIPNTQGVEVWHPDVRFYHVYDLQTQKHIGSFYTDWFPRESKRGGAWMNYLITGDVTKKNNHPHVGLICGNLTPPIGDAPALLSHEDVLTIFHEFGHLLHHLLTNVEVKSLAGVKVAWDFIELPSQILENWCWEQEALNLFARHYKTGENIPNDLFKKMLAARNYMQGSFTLRQLYLSKMDLELHVHYTRYVGQNLDILLDTLLKDYIIEYKTKSPHIIYNFTHVFADPVGYAAGYYSYKWAEVLDADAFTRFQSEGILNAHTGFEFREKILSKGNSEAPDLLFKNFMGRDPNVNALLIRSGLKIT